MPNRFPIFRRPLGRNKASTPSFLGNLLGVRSDELSPGILLPEVELGIQRTDLVLGKVDRDPVRARYSAALGSAGQYHFLDRLLDCRARFGDSGIAQQALQAIAQVN